MKTVKVKVTARAGRNVSGYGSRQQGEIFNLPPEVADYVIGLDGFELVNPPRPKREEKPADPVVEEKAEDNGSL